MRAVLAFLIAAAVAIGAAWWMSELGGHVSATLAGYTVEMATPLALLALALLVLVAAFLLRLIFAIFGLPARFRRWWARRRRAEGERCTIRSLVAIAAGNQAQALKQTARARKLLGDNAQTLLHAAEAARLAGQEDEAEALYRQLAARGDAGFLGLRGLFRQAVARQDWPEASRLARQAEVLQSAPSWLRAERSEVAIRTGNWQQAIALAGPGAPTAAYAVAAADAEKDAGRALRMAKRALKDSPDFVPAALVYARRLREAGRESQAQSVLRDAWKIAPHPDLAALALAPFSSHGERRREAARLVRDNPTHVESLFLLATLALAAGSAEGVAEARRHAEAARHAGLNQQRLWRLFADIDAVDLTGASLLKPRDALRQAVAAEPDPGWRCESCGTPQASWQPVCPVCHTPGRVSWGTAVGRALARLPLAKEPG
jgi:HemY protein